MIEEPGHPWHCDQLVEFDRMMERHRRLDRLTTFTFIVWAITGIAILLS